MIIGSLVGEVDLNQNVKELLIRKLGKMNVFLVTIRNMGRMIVIF